MREGWLGDEYIVLFEEQGAKLQQMYGLPDLLPSFKVIGLRSWDEFLVENATGELFAVPTVPLIAEHLESYRFEEPLDKLLSDEQVHGKIKWYVTPLIFGGDAAQGDNVTSITLAQHTELVQWWNKKYRDLSG
jgi:hypothetical protein